VTTGDDGQRGRVGADVAYVVWLALFAVTVATALRLWALTDGDVDALRALVRYRGVLPVVGQVVYPLVLLLVAVGLLATFPRLLRATPNQAEIAAWIVAGIVALLVLNRASVLVLVLALAATTMARRREGWATASAVAAVLALTAVTMLVGADRWPAVRLIETPGDSYEIGRVLHQEDDGQVVLLLDDGEVVTYARDQYYDTALRCTAAGWWARPVLDLRDRGDDPACGENNNIPRDL
jgi:hypothetical protein